MPEIEVCIRLVQNDEDGVAGNREIIFNDEVVGAESGSAPVGADVLTIGNQQIEGRHGGAPLQNAHRRWLSKSDCSTAKPTRATFVSNAGKGAPKIRELRMLAPTWLYEASFFSEESRLHDQGGDTTGTGEAVSRAGRELQRRDHSSPRLPAGYKAGTVAMANAVKHDGSQFFIMHSDYALPPSYTIFGRVTEGQDVVNAIATSQTGRDDRPASEVKMEKVTIEE